MRRYKNFLFFLKTVAFLLTSAVAFPSHAVPLDSATAKGYEDWIRGFGLDFTSGGAPEGDASGDGVKNLMKFAMGMCPLTYQPMPTAELNGSFLELRYTVSISASIEARISVEYRSDITEDWGMGNIVTSHMETIGGIETRMARVAIKGDTRGFFRLKVWDWWWEVPPAVELVATKDPNEITARMELLRSSEAIDADTDPWIERYLLGKSSVGGLDIWKYTFTPPDYKKTVILTNAIHGSETYGAHLMPKFFGFLQANWEDHPVLEYLRWKVRWVVIPLANPYGFSIGRRGVPETEAFPITWTRSKDVITVSYDPAAFPDTAGRLTAAGYIGEDSVDKLRVWVQDSSDTQALPNGDPLVRSVVNDHAFTVAGLDEGATSGTATMQVWVDPNRNFATDGWPAMVSSNGTDLRFNRNKGTRPFSLAETIAIKKVFEDYHDFDIVFDLHNGVSEKYKAFIRPILDQAPMRRVLHRLQFLDETAAIAVSSNATTIGMSVIAYASEAFNKPGITPEFWSSGHEENPRLMREALQWYANLFAAYVTE